MTGHDSTSKRALLSVLVLLAAVVLPRIVAGFVSAEYYFTRGDLNWNTLALNLIDGKGLLITRAGAMGLPMYAHRPPIFALILAGTYATAGRTVVAVVMRQARTRRLPA